MMPYASLFLFFSFAVAASLKANIGQLQLLFNGAGEGDAAIKKARYEETLVRTGFNIS